MLILSTLAGWLELGIQRWTDTFYEAPPGRLMLLSYHFRGEKLSLREVRSPIQGPTARQPRPPRTVELCCEPQRPGHSPQVQLVPHGMVAVGEGPHLALLVRQVFAELAEIVLQCAAHVLHSLQLAV